MLLGLGLLLVSAGLLLMHGLTVQSEWTDLLAGFLVAGVGHRPGQPAAGHDRGRGGTAAAPGMASGINTTFRQVGIATGIAALGAVFQSTISDKVTSGLAPLVGGRASALADLVVNQEVPRALAQVPAQSRGVAGGLVQSSFIEALNDILLIGSIVALVAAVLTFLLVRTRDFVASPSSDPAAAAAAH